MIEFFPSFSTFVTIFGISIQWYAIMILTGAFIAYGISEYNFKKSAFYQKELLSDFFFKVMLIGIAGARLWFVAFYDLGYYLSNPIEILMVRNGGLAIQGGIIAGVIFAYFYFKKHRLPFLAMADMIVPNVLIAQALGRWGNFFNQEAFGQITTLEALQRQMIPSFIIDKMYIDGAFRQPTFLYESVLNILAFILIVFVIKKWKKRKDGDLAASYFILYGLVRVFVEGMRSDSLMLGPIKMAQLTAIVLMLGGIGLMIFGRLEKKKPVILFDLDGTLIHTNDLIFESFKHTFNLYKPDYELSEEELISFLGPTLKDTFNKYFDDDMLSTLIDAYRDHNLAHHEDLAYVYPGVIETLEELKQRGYRLGVVTSKFRDSAMHGLELFKLTDYFEVVIGLDDVQNHKPDPEGILKAMDILDTKKAIYVGDNPSDMMAAKRADVLAVGVEWSMRGAQSLLDAGGDVIIKEMKEVLTLEVK